MNPSLPPYQLSVDGFDPGHFRVHSFTGKETISSIWSFDLVVTGDAGGDAVEQTALGKRATLLFNVGDAQRAFYGIVASVRVAQAHQVDHSIKYHVRVVPRLWLLKRKQRTRIFQNMRVPDIVTSVLLEAGIDARWQLTRTYPQREYCTQYEETDYRFVTRILAEAGIFFYFPQGPAVDAAALAADSVVSAVAGAGSTLIGDVAGQGVGALVGSVASMAETLIPGDTFVGADDAVCYPPLRGDNGAALAASTATALASAAADVLGIGGGIAGAAIGAASAVAGTVIADLTEGAQAVPVLHFLANEEAAVQKQDKVTRFSLRNTVRSSAATFRDYDPDRPMVRLQSKAVSTAPFPPSPFEIAAAAAAAAENVATTAESVVPGASGALSAVDSAISTVDSAVNEVAGALGQKVPFEVYEHHGDFLFPKWAFGSDEAPRILRQKRRRASVAEGEGGCSDLCAGHRFALDDHPAQQLDGDYVVVAVEHRGQAHPEGEGRWTVYWNAFECAPAVMPYVPPRPRRKSVQVALTATVVGPRGEDIHVDEKGQIKVQFHWDREGTYDENSSCWIRTMQPWGGAGWGHQFIPRIGMEVVVTFEGGDPDKPMVLGSLYNGTHPFPFKLPEDKTRSGIRTHSSPGGGFNELSFEDAGSQEQIYLHAQRNLDEVVGLNHTLLVRNDELVRILRNRVDRVEKDLEEHVGGDHKTQVTGNRVDVVEGSADHRVSGALVTRVEGKERREVQQNADLVYTQDLTTRVLGCQTTIVGKNDQKRAWVTHAEGTAELSGLDRVRLVSEKEVLLVVGKSSLRIAPDRIELHAPTVTTTGAGGGIRVGDDGVALKSKDKAKLTMGKEMALQTDGASMNMGQEVTLQGQKIHMKSPDPGSGDPDKDPDPPTKVELKDQDGNPVPYQRFVVKQDDGAEIGGKTDKDGKAEPDLKSGGKIIFPDLTMPDDKSGKGDPAPYVVKQGEYLAKLAFVRGFDADDVWNDGKNADLKQKRPDPNVLAPGDVLQIPTAKKEGQPISKGTTNPYTVNIPKVKVDLLFRDGDQPLADRPCEVLGLGAPDASLPQTTDGGGKLSLDVPVTTREFFVSFPGQDQKEGTALHYFMGDIDPVDEGSGVTQRLVNLGYLPAYFDDDADRAADLIKNAVAAFQAENGLDPSGVVDDATRKALMDGHQV
jgi:uncharacterized protein involved in type VI secretion and phage assembly